ncbi:ABC transporter substrate-binding protein [bacterium]|nr:ABC transporter substrate-binding protein [bacterium]MBU1063740.1 ABC transporter substrate-binding protein [bacterium]MBU1633005.1 ABC transporter substrate-binding protein [bacterium]MBU1873044.1 ABC transporter substrate-binding protein [bacterium]
MKFLKTVLILFILINLAFSQFVDMTPDSTRIEPVDSLKLIFREGVRYYNQERYWDALNVFEKFNAIPESENHLLSASGLLLIKTYLRLGDLDLAIQMGREFVLIHKTSRYLDDAEYALAEAYLIKGMYSESIFHYLNVMQSTNQERLRFMSKQTLETIVDLFISTEQLVTIIENNHEDFHKIFLTLKLAEKYHLDGDTRQAEKELRVIKGMIKGPYFNNEFVRTSERLKNRAQEKVYIGIILPLTGPMAPIGNNILNGVRYAIHQFRANSDKDITAIAMDNRGEVVESIKKVEYLCNNPKVRAIFGPVTSENTIAVAAVANQRKVPQISPTATSSEISSLGPYIFQANVDFENLGRFLGKYSNSISKVMTVASISPADEFGKELTDAFCRTVDERGGHVVSQQWYHGAPEELKYQFSGIRVAGLGISHKILEEKIEAGKQKLLGYTLSDSLWLTDSIYVDIYGDQYRIFRTDSVYVADLKQALILTGIMDSTEFLIPKVDSLEYRITSIDGLLVPAYASDLKMLIPQLEYYNLSAKIFGSANWNDPEMLKKHPMVSRQLTFISDYYIDKESRFYKNFERNYSRLLESPPGRFDLYGYDTMRALLSVFDESDNSRETIRKKLAQMPTYRGICRDISFRGNRPRVNSCAFIMKMEGGIAKPVAVIENGDLTTYTPRY